MADAATRRIWGWYFFDWASQPYNTLLLTFIFAPYVKDLLGDGSAAQAAWGYGVSAAGVTMALLAPLLGAVDTAVMGHLPDPAFIGAVALGAGLFSILYWGFGFLRMGTTGFVAQAVGGGDGAEAGRGGTWHRLFRAEPAYAMAEMAAFESTADTRAFEGALTRDWRAAALRLRALAAWLSDWIARVEAALAELGESRSGR